MLALSLSLFQPKLVISTLGWTAIILVAVVDFTITLTAIGGGAMGGDGVGVIMAGAGIIAITPIGDGQHDYQQTTRNILLSPKMGPSASLAALAI